MWAIYGVVESTATVLGPFVKVLAHAMFAGKPEPSVTPFPINTWFTLFVLVAYPIIGWILSAIIAAITIYAGFGRQLANNDPFWLAASTLILSVIFGAFALSVNEPFVLAPVAIAIALSAARFRIGNNPRSRLGELTNPLTISLVLVGGSIVAEPRQWVSAPLSVVLVVVYGVLVFIVASLFYRLRRLHAVEGSERSWRRYLIVYSILVPAIVGATLLTHDHIVTPDALPPRRAVSDPRPNVILITLDSVRADHLSLYGYARNTTPGLNRFAKTAVVYTSAISSANNTLPSHAAIFTGAPPSRNGANRYFPNASTSFPNRIGPAPSWLSFFPVVAIARAASLRIRRFFFRFLALIVASKYTIARLQMTSFLQQRIARISFVPFSGTSWRNGLLLCEAMPCFLMRSG